jgi:AcrR family transcriptional regulator
MRDDILDAGVRVLQRQGALRFTTPRVAEAAGISVGSLYQYFPNKQSLLFAIHTRVAALAWTQVEAILDHPQWSARRKVARVAQLFFVAESADVAEMGGALQEAEIYFEDQPEYRKLEDLVLQRFTSFLRAALPGTTAGQVEFSAQIVITVLENVGKAIARRKLPQSTVRRWARECAQMLSDHLGLPM